MKKLILILVFLCTFHLSFAFNDEDYTTKFISGFSIKFNKKIEHIEEVQSVLKTLEIDLAEISDIVPAHILETMRRSPIWIRSDIKKGSACYHPAKQWLINNGINPAKAQCVEIVHYKNYLNYRQKNQKFILLHELAHLYHYQVLKADNAEIGDAFKAAKESGAYYNATLKVEEGKYRKAEKAYAMTNKFEYFAEITEAYFGSNDFYPFNAQELKEADPKGFALMEKIWSKKL